MFNKYLEELCKYSKYNSSLDKDKNAYPKDA